MRGVKVHQPRYQVLIYKTVQRKSVDGVTPTSERFRGTSRVIDLSPWLSDNASINTRKGVREPAGGFSIVVPDKGYSASGQGLESLYGLIEPMDLVEIRLQHGTRAGQAALPVVMRGFVSNIKRSESVTPDGKPVRSVTINGQDYGKIWQMLQIFYGPNYIIGQDILSGFRLLDMFGAGYANAISNKNFVKIAIEQIVNPFLAALLPKESAFPQITVNTDGVREGMTGISGIQTQEGNVYQLLQSYMDVGPFNELFLTEDDNGVYCVYRQNPALSLTGDPLDSKVTPHPYTGSLEAGATTLAAIDVFDTDVQTLEVTRSDDGVANYYWVQAPSFSLNSDVIQRQMGYGAADRASVDLSAYPNSATALFGTRLMKLSTHLGGAEIKNVKSGLQQADHEERDASLASWMQNRREFLVAQNRDNSILERGVLRMRGDERIRVGNYINLHRGNFSALYYVTDVAHEMLPYRGFYTSVTFERGLGFANRIKLNGGASSPYLAELVDTSEQR